MRLRFTSPYYTALIASALLSQRPSNCYGRRSPCLFCATTQGCVTSTTFLLSRPIHEIIASARFSFRYASLAFQVMAIRRSCTFLSCGFLLRNPLHLSMLALGSRQSSQREFVFRLYNNQAHFENQPATLNLSKLTPCIIRNPHSSRHPQTALSFVFPYAFGAKD